MYSRAPSRRLEKSGPGGCSVQPRAWAATSSGQRGPFLRCPLLPYFTHPWPRSRPAALDRCRHAPRLPFSLGSAKRRCSWHSCSAKARADLAISRPDLDAQPSPRDVVVNQATWSSVSATAASLATWCRGSPAAVAARRHVVAPPRRVRRSQPFTPLKNNATPPRAQTDCVGLASTRVAYCPGFSRILHHIVRHTPRT